MQVQEGGQTLEAVIIGGTSVIAGAVLVGNTSYPRRVQDYQKTFEVLKSLPVDLFLAAHGPFFGLSAKYAKLNGASNPFIDPTGYKTYVAAQEAAFQKEWERQQQIPTSTIPYLVSARGGLSSTSQGASAATTVGYARIQPGTASRASSGLAIFGFRQGNVLVSEAAVPASGLVSSGRIYAEVGGQVNTGLAVANPNSQAVTLTFYFTDANGQNFGNGSKIIGANGQIGNFLTEAPFNSGSSVAGSFGEIGSMQTGVAIANSSATAATVNFELNTLTGAPTGMTGVVTVPANGQVGMFLGQIQGFTTLASPFQGVLRVSTTSPGGISMVGLRGRYNERVDFLITTIQPNNESTAASATELFLPHLADGGGYTTQFILYNGSTDQSSSGSLRFFNQTGQTLSLSVR